MKTTKLFLAALVTMPIAVDAAELTLATAPPVVIETVPVAGTVGVDPAVTEIKVTYSKSMLDQSWSWSTWGQENYPETTGAPRYLADQRTCVLPVKLEAGRFYAIWLNSDRYKNFKDANQIPAVPYLLTFETDQPGQSTLEVKTPPTTAGADVSLLNDDQRLVLDWTDRQFRGFFDQRSFVGWSSQERAELESRLLDTLKGPETREYYQAINTLAALGGSNSVSALRSIAFDRRDKNNRDRWMAVRALGHLRDEGSVPDLVHLVYHGNSNTRWWAQISLVRITGRNFGPDWTAWGTWWNESGGQPPYKPEIIRWWNGQAEAEELAASLEESDKKFLGGLRK
jgi:RNA polymerase sigma-70 factor (ECF subfamily)